MKQNILSSILSLTALAITVLNPVNAIAQTIGGDVYGGGKQGAVNTGNTTATSTTAQTAVTLTKEAVDATTVTISDGATVRTVFGGGQNGRCYGQTNVTVEGGTIGAEKWTGSIHGGVFGAGDGSSAWVFGKENTVTIKGGTLYNNVYGGGNQADLMGCANVILQNGTYYGSVFGGARMANIYGHTFVKLDGQNGPAAGETPMIIPSVYGGNDISGTISTSSSNAWSWTRSDNLDISQIPITLENPIATATHDLINETWNCFVCSTYPLAADGKTALTTNNNMFIGNLYAGGNGDYNYEDGKLTLIDTPDDRANDIPFDGLTKPEVAKTYLNLQGGTFGYVYGGGNNATVTESADIMVWNAHFDGSKSNEPIMASIPADRVDDMGVMKSMFTISDSKATPSYQIDRIFGGNNKAAMAIQPHWYLAQGTFNNIYSGGNKGDMTNPNGILISIGSRSVFANNVYGGCRMANVRPMDGNTAVTEIPEMEFKSLKVTYNASGAFTGIEYSPYTFAKDYSARVYITEGHINNVYGGNDISGEVYVGTNVAINGAVSGNIYGGGNGSYAYTDNAALKDDPEYGDYYYSGSTIDDLNNNRPHVENTLLHIWGNENQQPKIADADGSLTATDADGNATAEQPIIITGGVFCGGNSATLKSSNGNTPTVNLKIGKNVVINGVYLGSNGENMVTQDILKTYAGSVNVSSTDVDYSSLDLTNKETFAKYMEGCAVDILPTVTYDWTEGEDPHTYIGSLYNGGNVGSLTYSGPITLNMPSNLVIYDQVVGGCNNANVAESTYNAAYEGGVINANTGADASKPKVTINMDSFLEPRELTSFMKFGFLNSANLYWDVRNYYGLKSGSTEKQSVFVNDAGEKVSYESVPWLPYGANVFGGCYTSGHIAGDVQINVTKDIVSQTMLHQNTAMTSSVSTPCNASINWVHLGEYIFAKTMTIYGGGYGKDTYIAGDTHINLSGDARVINVLGGADFGTIGCAKTDMHDAHTGDCYVTVATNMTDYSKVDATKNVDADDTHLPYNVTKIYGGAYAGTIFGHTELRLNGGSYQQAYAGSCNADIADYASLYLGTKETMNTGFPYVYLYAFGGNDFGGYIGRDGSDNTKTDLLAGSGFGDAIKGYHDFTSTDGQAGYGDKTIRTTRYVEYNSGRIGYQYDATKSAFNEETGEGNFLTEGGSKRSSIYGGSYGSYDYSLKYACWDYVKERLTRETEGTEITYDFDPADASDPNKFHYPLMKEYIPTAEDVFTTNTFVNVACTSTNTATDVIQRGILAGGRGTMEQTGIVDAGQTYVYLHGANWQSRNANLSYDVYGGGYYSIAEKTKVDAQSGCTNIIYGGSYGTSAVNLQKNNLLNIDFSSTNTEVNLYNGMDNSNMTIFGGGGYAGSANTNVNLYGGLAHNVYGGSYNEGYCGTTNVNVPENSTASVNAIFGGGYGNDVTLPCDENETNVTFSSSTAYVADVIYGGNNAKRAAKKTNVVINSPVKTNATGTYVSVCGAGNGASTIAGFTNVTLNSGAIVNNVYGGGRDGKVFGFYKNINENARTYYDETYNVDPASSTKRHEYAAWKWTSSEDGNNTKITINQGATAQTIYGGGYGSDATVAGSTSVYNMGGTVTNNIYGGGYAGNVLYQTANELATVPDGYDNIQKNNIYTYVSHHGGTVTNIYGGGLDGQVGSAHDVTNHPAYTYVNIGEEQDVDNYYAGCPIVLRSVYGGGYRGAVLGTANIKMNNGYIGYNYDADATDDETTIWDERYSENLKSTADDTNNLLKESGNIFGGGYGEGATTDHTIVNMYGGTIRNSLYGGGEIASVGVADQATIDINDRTKIPNITVAGSTEVSMYGGLVSSNVFGGGRGYAIDAYGKTAYGEKGYSDGYTFGKTNVNIYRGTIGTDATLADGNGNVFGGGNIGYVYAADSRLTTDYKNVYKSTADGYYHTTYGDKLMTEDSKVVIEPVCKALAAGTVNKKEYKKGDIISHADLDAITSASAWTNDVFGNLDNQGVTIRNAVFAGGNVTSGSDQLYANTVTIYGNSTASVIDCLNKDLVTIGADDIGGLYGDGNLTFVDGYRELNITNYGTDYYNLDSELSYDKYLTLNERERSYFEVKYVCNETYGSYKKDDDISETQYNNLSDDDKKHWRHVGLCSIYAGRVLNTIQRADFCGVFGSRMVLTGAQDRVPSEVDFTKYTINRIGELSLNQKNGRGSYFGIYNVVNKLGALTSDVEFGDIRTADDKTADGKTYSAWKNAHLNDRSRNNGTSKNKVGLASGVWLEIVKQKAESSADTDVYGMYEYNEGEKIYGPITGIVELDLISAATGEGGGYVYALNAHGEQSSSGAVQTTLTSANAGAASYKQFTYAKAKASDNMETSGNVINSIKNIVDDCYPNSEIWMTDASSTSKGHYWFIRGDYYVYEQNISAYSGASQSYTESAESPLSISAHANGKLKLLSVQENLNAYWTQDQYDQLDDKYKLKNDNSVIVINGKSYSQNSPISYWDYSNLSTDLRDLFTKDTYVCTKATGSYTEGQVLKKADYDKLSTDVKANFQISNALNSDNGFLLTCNWANPKVWGQYYIDPTNYQNIITKETKEDNTAYNDYMSSPTYMFKDPTNLYGQKTYNAGELISKTTFDSQPTDVSKATSTQAAFEVAYVAKDECYVTFDGIQHHYVKGGTVSATDYNKFEATEKDNFESAYTCVSTYQVSEDKYYTVGEIVTATEYNNMSSSVKNAFSPAYICTTAGAWGGKLFEENKNYEALYYTGLSAEDRLHFTYNLDAFDVLQAKAKDDESNPDDLSKYVTTSTYQRLPNYEARHSGIYAYAEGQSIDYTATYNGEDNLTTTHDVTVIGSSTPTTTIKTDDVISSSDYERYIVNEQAKYAHIVVQKDNDDYYDSDNKKYYVVKSGFWIGDECYSLGKQISLSTYESLSTDNKNKVDIVDATNLRLESAFTEGILNYYYCTTPYTATTAVTSVINNISVAANDEVTAGTIISADDFSKLKDYQKDFTIASAVPTETSTLYVSPSIDANLMSEDKIMTVVYEYSYTEATENNSAYETVNERHILNIRVHYENGLPTIGKLIQPDIVLPGTALSLNQPSVTQGAYDIISGGWEIYSNHNDAQSHTNGQAYTNNNTKLYWYQNGYEVAYYAKTYLGKTYSNPVTINVANYHRMADVMGNEGDNDGDGTADYMYLNEAGKNSGIRNPKVYVKDASELDQMATFFGLTKGGSTGFESIANCANIDFIIDGDIDHTATWTSLGDATNYCFSGNIHGDGHTISGLDHSLLGSLCGNVYNLGVTGSYTGSGITDAGGGNAYNCWVATTGTLGSVQNGTAVLPIHGGTGTTTNCYYYNDYASREGATKSDLSAFIDGEVAYKLNSYYLAKRNDESDANYSYVTTTRYGNEDFIYADGVIPQKANIRKKDDGTYVPQYPDDYIFFGQKLTYGIIPGTTTDSHAEHPQAVNRITNADDEDLNTKLIDTDLKTANRVYRAPAYYKSKTMGCAYFNKPTAFKDSYTMASGNIYNVNTAVDLPYKNMTAIDFTGYNDDATTKTLDYEGLTAFATSGLTRNLLVYADPTNDATSYSVLEDKLPEATLTMNAAGKGYNEVAIATDAAQVKGHLVDKTTSGYVATRSHYLVDKEFFNCPISYTFTSGSNMWYQRKPDNYVNSSSEGWEAISLPFTAAIVSTQTKGEITHFYTGSDTGHEYWLRSFDSVGSADANGNKTEGTVYANFSSLAAGTESKTVANTFLWDYYYNNSSKLEYYNSERTYSDYPLYEAAVPYIIGFPGNRFYEFDMSGNFEPAGYSGIDKIAAQTVSFISEDKATIAVSDEELEASTANGYSYMPNYSNETIAVGSYVANSTGSGFDKTTAEQAAVPFRPYFKATTSDNAKRICFSSSLENMEQKGEELSSAIEGKLIAYAKRGAIVVESTLKDPQQVTITNVAGITVCSFTINEGETIPTSINYGGVYIVNSSYSGLRGRKLSVK